jgi:chemotaxis response regulator CheB
VPCGPVQATRLLAYFLLNAALEDVTRCAKTPAGPSPQKGRGPERTPTDTAQDFHIVSVGGSAGGLEPLERLFSHLAPDTGMAFVVLQHLSPDFKTLMDELLA